jgi:hypothetical protein
VYGFPPYGYPAWPAVPRPPRKPGQLVTAAVLAFVQAALVLLSSVYVYFLASLFDLFAQEAAFPSAGDGLAVEGSVLASIQVASAGFLVFAGIRALMRRTVWAWRLLVAALAVQVVIAVYWLVRLIEFDRELPGPDSAGPFVVLTFFYAAMPAVALGLTLLGAGKRWFTETVQQTVQQ